jgi:aminoglycoside phosphotransferase family enzyme
MSTQAHEKTLPGRPASRNANPAALVRELLRPEAYPAPRPSGVEVRQTHGSWVFLTEDEAWKVKRPVSRDGLEPVDADGRRHLCEEEVRLGRRLAPDVYQGVVPVHRSATGHSFAEDGPVVDFAVRMHRLPDEHSAAVLLSMGRLTFEHVQRLAALLAGFYQRSPALPATAGLLRASIFENYQLTLPFAGRLVDAALVERLYHWQRERLAGSEEHLLERVARGCIRDGHGDLRLEHVYFSGGHAESPLVIDPLESDSRLRCGDVALDLASLVQELEARERPDLSAAFLGRFASASSDYDFYPLLDLYVSYRAWTRARVACRVAADPTTAPAKASRKATEARQLFALAAAHL